MHAVECTPVVVRPISRSKVLGPVFLLTFDISELTRFLGIFILGICKDSDRAGICKDSDLADDEAPRMTVS